MIKDGQGIVYNKNEGNSKYVDLTGRNTKILYRMSRGEHKNIGTFKQFSFSFGEESWLKKLLVTLQQHSQMRMRK